MGDRSDRYCPPQYYLILSLIGVLVLKQLLNLRQVYLSFFSKSRNIQKGRPDCLIHLDIYIDVCGEMSSQQCINIAPLSCNSDSLANIYSPFLYLNSLNTRFISSKQNYLLP